MLQTQRFLNVGKLFTFQELARVKNSIKQFVVRQLPIVAKIVSEKVYDEKLASDVKYYENVFRANLQLDKTIKKYRKLENYYLKLKRKNLALNVIFQAQGSLEDLKLNIADIKLVKNNMDMLDQRIIHLNLVIAKIKKQNSSLLRKVLNLALKN